MALRSKSIDFAIPQIHMKNRWSRRYGLVDVKGKESPVVSVTREIGDLPSQSEAIGTIRHLLSVSDGNQPVDHKAVDKHLNRALPRIGIPED